MSATALVLRNTTAQMISKFISSGTAFVVTLFLARTFGAVGFGEFTKITAYISFFYLLADFGLNAVFITESSDTQQQLRTQISSFLLLRAAAAAGLILLALGILPFLPAPQDGAGFTQATQVGIVIFAITIATQATLTTANALFQKTLAYWRQTVAVVGGSVVVVLFVGLAATGTISSSVLSMVGVLSAGGVVMAAVALGFIWSELGGLSAAVDLRFVRVLVRKGFVLGLVLFASLVVSQSSKLLLAATRPTAEVGVYGLASKFFEFPITIPIFFINSIFPLLVLDKQAASTRLSRRIRSSFAWLLGGGIVLSVALFVAAPLLSSIKAEFAASIGVLRVLIVFLPVFFVSALIMWLFILYEFRRQLLAIYAVAALVHVGIGLLVIPRFGMFAAAVLTGTTEVGIMIVSGFVLLLKLRNHANK